MNLRPLPDPALSREEGTFVAPEVELHAPSASQPQPLGTFPSLNAAIARARDEPAADGAGPLPLPLPVHTRLGPAQGADADAGRGDPTVSPPSVPSPPPPPSPALPPPPSEARRRSGKREMVELDLEGVSLPRKPPLSSLPRTASSPGHGLTVAIPATPEQTVTAPRTTGMLSPMSSYKHTSGPAALTAVSPFMGPRLFRTMSLPLNPEPARRALNRGGSFSFRLSDPSPGPSNAPPPTPSVRFRFSAPARRLLPSIADQASVRLVERAGSSRPLPRVSQPGREPPLPGAAPPDLQLPQAAAMGHAAPAEEAPHLAAGPAAFVALCVTTLGVVFGDLGTSPIYTLASAFDNFRDYGGELAEADVLGVVSLIMWSLILVPTLKYCLIVLSADFNGEGGTMALLSLLSQRDIARRTPRILQRLVTPIGLAGASLLIGGGVLTPAISVLSSMEGIQVVYAAFPDFYVIVLTCVILVLLFLAQSTGTAVMGLAFGPVIILWFLSLGAVGLYNIIVHDPRIFEAFDPVRSVTFFTRHGPASYSVLGFVVLSITGVEVMYADMSHFGKQPIRASWIFLAYPMLVLQYLGQGAYLLANRSQAVATQLFFESLPNAVYWPMFALTTMATVIASQAAITGAFTVVSQAIHLQYLPRLKIVHTSEHMAGRIYIPLVNWVLLVMTLLIVVGFRHSTTLANAYGLTVCLIMLLTTNLVAAVMIWVWGMHWLLVLPLYAVMVFLDGLYTGSCFTRIAKGGWIPLVFSSIVLLVFIIYRTGTRKAVEAENRVRVKLMIDQNSEVPLLEVSHEGIDDEVSEVDPDSDDEDDESGKPSGPFQSHHSLPRPRPEGELASPRPGNEEAGPSDSADHGGPEPELAEKDVSCVIEPLMEMLRQGEIARPLGTGKASVFFTRNVTRAPLSLYHFVGLTHLIPETLVLMSVEFSTKPFVPEARRMRVWSAAKYGGPPWLFAARIRFGFAERQVLAVHDYVTRHVLPELPAAAEPTYFLTQRTYVIPERLPAWKRLWLECFEWMARNARPAYKFFHLPSDAVMMIGSQIQMYDR